MLSYDNLQTYENCYRKRSEVMTGRGYRPMTPTSLAITFYLPFNIGQQKFSWAVLGPFPHTRLTVYWNVRNNLI